MSEGGWDAWLAGLDPATRSRALALRRDLETLGARDAELWVRSEVTEGIAQVARYRFLRTAWSRAIDSWSNMEWWLTNTRRMRESQPDRPRSTGEQAILDLLDAGVPIASIEAIARMVALETLHGLLYLLGDPHDDDIPAELADRLPYWVLMEAAGEHGELTGRDVGMLFEDISGANPDARQFQDAHAWRRSR